MGSTYCSADKALGVAESEIKVNARVQQDNSCFLRGRERSLFYSIPFLTKSGFDRNKA